MQVHIFHSKVTREFKYILGLLKTTLKVYRGAQRGKSFDITSSTVVIAVVIVVAYACFYPFMRSIGMPALF